MKRTRILYLEDEIFLGKIVKESLESCGFSVFMESDGNKALERIQETTPDVCILDIMLPNQDGFSIAAAIRKTNMQLPIVFLTARTQTEDVVKGFKLGANDYIRKPFSMEELIVRIERLLHNNTAAPGPSSLTTILSIGNYTFYPRKQLLICKDQKQKLSFRESRLLQFLYEGRQDIVLRSDILMQLWGSDSFFNSRNLDVYITKLRGYLKQDPSVEILTIKGTGYRFVID